MQPKNSFGIFEQKGVSKKNGIPKSSIVIGFSITNHPFWGTPTFGKHPKEKMEKKNASICFIVWCCSVERRSNLGQVPPEKGHLTFDVGVEG